MPLENAQHPSRDLPARRPGGGGCSLSGMAWAWCAAALVATAPAAAYDVVGYTPAANNRFSSGFPSAPVTNTAASFVGLPYSWLGVGWAGGDPTKGFGFITPKHYVVARHYGGAPTITLLSASGQLVTGTQASVTDTGYGFVQNGQTVGDLSIGKLTASLPAAYGLPRYGVLDANTSSTTSTTYVGQPLLVYGRGADGTQSPRIGPATVRLNGWTVSGGTSSISSTVATGTLQSGDSGSPDFIPWINPNGADELTIIGNNAATDFFTINVYNFMGSATVMSAINSLTAPDGYALRVVGTPSNTWVGSSSTSIGSRAAWGLSPPAAVPADKYVLFSGTSAGNGRAVTVDINANERGLYFKSSGSGTAGFTFAGGSTLTIGRGGITNYDTSRQTFTAAIALAASQYWNVGPGGVTVAAVNTGTAGSVLEIDGSGTARFTGTISGSGGIALTGQRLELTGANTYSGGTWVRNGTLTAAAGALATTSAIRVESGVLEAVTFNPAAELTVAATGSAAITTLSGGAVAIAGGAVSVESGTFGGVITGSAGRFVKTGGGTLALASSNTFSGSTSVQGGVLALSHATALGASRVNVVAGGTLAVAGYLDTTVGGLEPNAGGLVDVGTGGMTVTAGLSASELFTALVAGRSGGTWTGTSGITSAAAAADIALGLERGVGWLDNGDGSVFFSFAAPGDTNLDGLVDTLDTANFLAAAKYNKSMPASWLEGDFTNDGIVDILDAASFFSTGLYDQGFYNQPPGATLSAGFGGPLIAAVPEPSALFTLVAACAAALVSRRGTARGTAGGGSSWGGCRPGPRFRRRDARARSAAPVRSR